MTLGTERLRLRPIEDRDAADVVALDSDPEVMRYLGSPKETLEAARAWIVRARSYPEGTGYWAAEHEARFVGWFLLRPANLAPHEMELGYRLRREFWGRGFATEGGRALLDHAWRALPVPTVMATAHAENVRSQRVMRKLGMAFVEEFLHDGREPSVRFRLARPEDEP